MTTCCQGTGRVTRPHHDRHARAPAAVRRAAWATRRCRAGTAPAHPGQLVELQPGGGPQAQAQRRPRPRLRRQPQVAQIADVAGVFGVGQLERPQRHLVPGAVLARGLIGRARARCAATVPRGTRYPSASAPSLRLGCIWTSDHRRRRRQIVGIDHLQQVLGEPREFGVDLQLDARRQKGESFQQSLDVRIGALEGLQPQPAGDLGKVAGELARPSRACTAVRGRSIEEVADPFLRYLTPHVRDD